jgi:hypothetical protein
MGCARRRGLKTPGGSDLLDGVGRHDQVAVVRLERWLRARGYDEEADRVAYGCCALRVGVDLLGHIPRQGRRGLAGVHALQGAANCRA